MKKIIFCAGIAVFLLLAVAMVVTYFSLNSIVKSGVETTGPKLAGVEVRLEGAQLLPFSGRGELNQLFIGNPEGYKSLSAIEVRHIKVALQLSSVLSDTVVIQEIMVDAPQITIEGGLTKNNLTAILDNLEKSLAREETQPGQKAEERKFLIHDLTIRGGSIKVAFGILGGRGITVPLPDLHLQNIGSSEGGATAAELAVQIMKPLLASITKVVSGAISGLGTGLLDSGKGTLDQINQTTKGVKRLLGR